MGKMKYKFLILAGIALMVMFNIKDIFFHVPGQLP